MPSLTNTAKYIVKLNEDTVLKCIRAAVLEEVLKWHPTVTDLVEVYFEYTPPADHASSAVSSKFPFYKLIASVKVRETGFFKAALSEAKIDTTMDIEIAAENVEMFLVQEARKAFGGSTERMEISVKFVSKKISEGPPAVSVLEYVEITGTPKAP